MALSRSDKFLILSCEFGGDKLHYDDIWNEEHSEQFKKEREASESRKQLLETLNAEEMVKIMFKDFLHRLSDSKIFELKRDYVDHTRMG